MRRLKSCVNSPGKITGCHDFALGAGIRGRGRPGPCFRHVTRVPEGSEGRSEDGSRLLSLFVVPAYSNRSAQGPGGPPEARPTQEAWPPQMLIPGTWERSLPQAKCLQANSGQQSRREMDPGSSGGGDGGGQRRRPCKRGPQEVRLPEEKRR